MTDHPHFVMDVQDQNDLLPMQYPLLFGTSIGFVRVSECVCTFSDPGCGNEETVEQFLSTLPSMTHSQLKCGRGHAYMYPTVPGEVELRWRIDSSAIPEW